MGTWQPGEDEQNTPAAQQGRGAPRRALCAALVALAAFVATLLFGSGLSLLPPAGAAPRAMPLSRAHLQDAALLPEGIWVPGTGGSTATFYLAGTESRTLQVQLYAEDTADFPVTVSLYLLADDASADARILADRAVLNPAGRHNSAVLMLHSYGKLYGFELEFSTASGAFLLTDVTLNQSGFAFNFPLFLLLLALGLGGWAVWAFGLWRAVWQPQKRSHRRAMRAMVALCVLLVFGIMLAVSPPPAPGDSLLLQPYTPENLPANAHYVHLFDALYNGQLALRTAPDAALATLQNPYDASQRGSIPFFWDMAYYNGQYYCYFGLAPMPLYFLVHALTGRLPSPALAAGVPAMLAVLLLWAALKELLLRWEVKANLLLLALGFPALCLGGGLGLLAASADTYVQPYLWATAGLAGCVWLFYRALRCQSGA
ncbi:hypothetical protein LJC04_03770, partial [Ruminococcaceae bacterium OttesenSCG-928-O06]|nr:hypothetical protein [Ruminococcaceae bacterium OttesenSCG-928-O06]